MHKYGYFIHMASSLIPMDVHGDAERSRHDLPSGRMAPGEAMPGEAASNVRRAVPFFNVTSRRPSASTAVGSDS